VKKLIRENKGFIVFLLTLGVFRTAIADWNPIPSASMHPNLLEGDVVFVNRIAYDLKVPLTDISVSHLGEPQRGDVVTFFSPEDRTRLIKRIAALPGDRVEIRGEHLIINGRTSDYAVLGNATEHIDKVGDLQACSCRSTMPTPATASRSCRKSMQSATSDRSPCRPTAT